MPSLEVVKKLAEKYNINTRVVPLGILKRAIEIEFEHRDIIDHNEEKSLKIALAHLREFPDYYQRLIKLESKAEDFWKNKVKPNIYTNGVHAQATQIGPARIKTQEAKGKRAGRDVYGVRKGARARRVQHLYTDYYSPETNRSGKQPEDKPKAKRNVSGRTTENRGVQTNTHGPEEQ
jgi:hypothetical protein